MSKYRKLIVAVIGGVLMALDDLAGISIALDAEAIVQVLIPILTAIGVWAAPNAEPSS